MQELSNLIWNITDSQDFNDKALQIFRFQVENNKIFQKFVGHHCSDYKKINSIKHVPFLPVEFFKTHKVVSFSSQPRKTFISSGTGGTVSRHFIHDISIYKQSLKYGFNHFYGDPENYRFLALLPAYIENKNSSLIFMVRNLMELTGYKESGFFPNDLRKLYEQLKFFKESKKSIILLGVSFALLDFAEKFKIDFPELIVMETGGMKGRRKEITREAIHIKLTQAFNVGSVHSEYGMTEMLSQAYSKGNGVYKAPPWMKVFIRDIYDPLSLVENGKTGLINIIDLANIFSCSFIATQDLGRVYKDGSFEVLGRAETSDIRGCNLMVF
ncbi:MAG: acyltransferase [Bacteroidales bacterium]|nr:acyltransferase [Bacteroidales bacterium]